jgi:hypothetical protein
MFNIRSGAGVVGAGAVGVAGAASRYSFTEIMRLLAAPAPHY